MLTAINLLHTRFILPEVQSLSRVDLRPYSQLKVLIRDLPVLVQVKLVKQVLELRVREIQTPMLEVETQLLGENRTRFLHV